ncbi:transforming growth factor-beta-induced protein ig-h3-like [Mytilus californianus]|uniref:transforming growth factor-beta-induced protein ig-h3-like n=1 Tax=Mytilus californianus TaxID=6549 RepID=UPI00224862BD|nr:transforming growth factor-beta-induced protein ig-h3-like [Mytilus californianus]
MSPVLNEKILGMNVPEDSKNFQSAGKNNVLDVAYKLGATTFLSLVTKTNLTAKFNLTGHATVFIPSNDAFIDLPDEQKENLKDLSYAKEILLYHLVSGRHDKKSFRNEALYQSRSKMEDEDSFLKVRVNIYHGGKIITAGGSPIVNFDHEATNGIVHILSRVMFWPPAYGSVAQIVNIPITTFMAYGLMDGGLSEQLSKNEPYTLFAPTDLPWEALPNKTMNKLRGNKTAIRRVMENHIVSGTYFTNGLKRNDTLTTLLGEELRVDSIIGNVTVNGSHFVLPDISATNGVVHITTKIFWPTDFDWEH